MGMPSITISFTEVAASAVKRGERGIIAMILKDTVPSVNPITCKSEEDIPKTLTAANQEQIKLALMGYINAPLRVVAYVIDDMDDIADALDALKTIKFNYLVVPEAETEGVTSNIVSFVKEQRADGNLIKAIVSNATADSEGIINYMTEKVMVNNKEYTAEKYCARIAGIIAGTPLNISCTYAPLGELTDCSRLTKAQMDAAVDAGKFIVWYDGEKVKTARGVNSLTTLTASKNAQFTKIKIVDAMDMITDDIKKTAEDKYLGKYPNTYDNKCLLLNAIKAYFDNLKNSDVISEYSVDIDVDANRAYLKSKGQDVDNMSDDEIKKANTGTYVYLRAAIKILDAIEDIVLPITI